MAINTTFVNQTTQDITKKLQWLDGFECKNLFELMAIAIKYIITGKHPEIDRPNVYPKYC